MSDTGWVPRCWGCGTTFGVSASGDPYCISCRAERAEERRRKYDEILNPPRSFLYDNPIVRVRFDDDDML